MMRIITLVKCIGDFWDAIGVGDESCKKVSQPAYGVMMLPMMDNQHELVVI